MDFDYTDKALPWEGPPPEIRVLEAGPLRAAVRVRRKFRGSEIIRTYVLEAGSARVDVEFRADWKEERTLLRALFPTGIRASHATFGIQFGEVERPTHRNTSFEEARFEVPGHKWMDLSQPGLGLAVLDDGTKFGRSCLGGSLGLSLLRGPRFPDPQADLGSHAFRYALLPHEGDRRRARVPEEADALADPWAAWIPSDGGESTGDPPGRSELAPFRMELPRGGSVEIAAFKPALAGGGMILRLVERHGALTPVTLSWARPGARWTLVDLLEEPMEREGVRAGSGRISFTLRPFEILTLRVREARDAGEAS